MCISEVEKERTCSVYVILQSIIVSWEAPPDDSQNGVITGYKIRYKERGEKGGDTVTTDGSRRVFDLIGMLFYFSRAFDLFDIEFYLIIRAFDLISRVFDLIIWAFELFVMAGDLQKMKLSNTY